jgi:2-polyprenyl-6-methoxyphenol hydroxylase-like FAD-dependent oxidoreductase
VTAYRVDPRADDRILIAGGGMAGSLLALVLARRGHAVCVVDPDRHLGPTFRNEKLGVDQIAHLDALGVLSCFQEAVWGLKAAQNGPEPGIVLPDMKDCGARYDRWIERVRAAWPANVTFIEGKVDHIQTSDAAQELVLNTGERVTGRLVVLATGRGERLRAALGIQREVFSAKHSLCLGLSIKPRTGSCQDVKAQVFHGPPNSRIAYMTLFPMLDEVRINLFAYHDLDDPWIAAMRTDSLGALAQALPAVEPFVRNMDIVRKLEIRSTDLYRVGRHVQPGVVLIGDAFHAPCPSSGTGMTRIINDVDRLANVYLPQWLATPGMGKTKIARFYADETKRRIDGVSLKRSLDGRAAAVSRTPYWKVRRRIGRWRRNLMVYLQREPIAAPADRAASAPGGH